MAAPYPATERLLELLQGEIVQTNAYGQLLQATNLLRNYLTETPEIDQALAELVPLFVNVMREAKEVTDNIDANPVLREAYSQFETEMLRVLGRLLLQSPAAKVAGVALLAAGAAAVVPALAVGTLGLVGFSSVGPVAGSLAAGIQSVFYGGAVASGSLFAICQSAAMGGIAVAGAAEIAAGVVALGAAAGLLRRRP